MCSLFSDKNEYFICKKKKNIENQKFLFHRILFFCANNHLCFSTSVFKVSSSSFMFKIPFFSFIVVVVFCSVFSHSTFSFTLVSFHLCFLLSWFSHLDISLLLVNFQFMSSSKHRGMFFYVLVQIYKCFSAEYILNFILRYIRWSVLQYFRESMYNYLKYIYF